MTKKRLSKALAGAGVASRRAAEDLIFMGRVQVNGETIRVPQTLVDFDFDRICVDGSSIVGEQKKVYYMVNKPKGVICSSARVGRRPIILDLFPDTNDRLFSIGRLDRDTTGLLLVTNDGLFSQKVIHPSSNVTKEYLVKTVQEIEAAHLETLSEGARIDDKWVKPVSVRKVRKGTFKIIVKEGRKHEVRIIAERARLEVVELTRIRIGGLLLGSLEVGAYRPLTENDKKMIFMHT